MALAKVDIEFNSANKISKLLINDIDLSESAKSAKVIVEEGSQRLIRLELACGSLNIKDKEDIPNEGGDKTTSS